MATSGDDATPPPPTALCVSKLKPEIRLGGLPLRDEIEFEYSFQPDGFVPSERHAPGQRRGKSIVFSAGHAGLGLTNHR